MGSGEPEWYKTVTHVTEEGWVTKGERGWGSRLVGLREKGAEGGTPRFLG